MTHTPATPRHPRIFAGVAGRAARALTTAVGALAPAPAPAHADDAVPSQEYFSYYHLDAARQKGYTGKGVTIAFIGGPLTLATPPSAEPTSPTKAAAKRI